MKNDKEQGNEGCEFIPSLPVKVPSRFDIHGTNSTSGPISSSIQLTILTRR